MGQPRRDIEARRLLGFAEVVGDRHFIAATVGPELDPVLLTLEQQPDYRIETAAGASFPKKRAGRPNRFRIHHRVADEAWKVLDLPETAENYHAVQPLGDEAWLLVRGRADGEGDRNAHVYDHSGKRLRSFHAGDGIQDVQATRGGQVWVSHFDEGVFGGTRLGQAGLARMGGSGECSFEFNRIAGGGVPGISDCYALNVASEREVWLYYYTDFPLVRLVDGRVDGLWPRFPVKGSPGFAIDGDTALFGGGYNDRDTLHRVRLGDKRAVKFALTDEHGRLLKRFSAFGRRDSLFLQTDEALYVVELPDRLPGGRTA